MMQELSGRSEEVGMKKNMAKPTVLPEFGMPKANLRVDGVDLREDDS